MKTPAIPLYDRKTSLEIVESFKIAKQKIKNNEEDYICFALTTTKQKRLARHIILYLLEGYETYEDWILANYPELIININYIEQDIKATKGRIDWLNWLIKFYKNPDNHLKSR